MKAKALSKNFVGKDGDPSVSVPIREIWLYRNPIALGKVREGLSQAAEGKQHDLGSFAKYADSKID
jgi:hypothetical protein